MTVHESSLELAAAAIDFDLEEAARLQLDRHLAECAACRRSAAALRADAVAIGSEAGPPLPPARSAAILAAIIRPPRRRPSLRLLAVAALFAVAGGGLIVAGMGFSRLTQDPQLVIAPSPSRSSTPGPSADPQAEPSNPAGPTALPPAGSPRPTESLSPSAQPVGGSAEELGTMVRMAPGAGDDLYVSIPAAGGVVLTSLDRNGRPRAGWPVVLAGTTSCELLLPAEDGSVRVVCTLEDADGVGTGRTGAFAFDPAGASMPGWPMILGDHGAEGYFAGRVMGDALALYVWATLKSAATGEPDGTGWIMAVAADGVVRSGTSRPILDCCDGDWAIGPDGVAYGVIRRYDDHPFAPAWSSELRAMSFDGVPDGFPKHHDSSAAERIMIDGIASRPAFDTSGTIRMVVAREAGGPARVAAYRPNGSVAVDTEIELGFVATDVCTGIEGTCETPAPPLVGADGTTVVVGAYFTSTAATAVDRGYYGILTGWPYASDAGHQAAGTCRGSDVCEGYGLALPALGPGNVLYLVHRASDPAVGGGSIVAVGVDGGVVAGWPVALTTAGAAFWSVVVGADGTAYALAIEPEAGGGSSATIVAMAPDSTVRWTTTIIEP